MTKLELIELLKQFPDEAQVELYFTGVDDYGIYDVNASIAKVTIEEHGTVIALNTSKR